MASSDKKAWKPSSRQAGNIRTLADLNRFQPDSDSDSDHDDPQEYYTGGQNSGVLVQDPSKENVVDAIFDLARQLGAVERPADQLLQPRRSRWRSFSGTGRRLLSGETVPPAPQPPEAVVHNITFWTNGFTIGDGPLRRMDDPQNVLFLETIRKSECPKELEPADERSSVQVNLIRKNEKYIEPIVPFQGMGRSIGSSSTSVEPESTATSAPLNTAPIDSAGLVLDHSLPSTFIQLRLSDGTRLVSPFNYHHTVGDIRAFIDTSRPEGGRNYQLQIRGFPPKLLSDETQTIEQAGLANSVVIQKF